MAEMLAGDTLHPNPVPAAEIAAAVGPRTRLVAPATVEHLLYALIFMAGLSARLLLLGAAPLATSEAAAAWAAWMDASALHPAAAPAIGSALLHALQTALFWLTGDSSETLARLPVALLSSLIPILPWFWRKQLGRPAALLLAVLLALDPWLLAFGRMADATALSATLALIALSALHVATRPSEAPPGPRAAAAIAAAAAGLLLVSGPQAWSWLPVLAFYLLFAAAERRALFHIRTLIIGGAAALLGATGWLAWPHEAAMVGESIARWFQFFSPGAYNLAWPPTRLLVDQPFLLTFGLAGFVLLWLRPARDGALRHFLTLWLAWALLLLLMPGRAPELLPLLGVPLAVCAALALQALLHAARTTEGWGEALLLALALGAALLALLFATTLQIAKTSPGSSGAGLPLLLLLLIVFMLAAFAYFVNTRQALVVASAVTALFLLAATISAGRQLAFANEPAHPNGFFATITWPEAAVLRDDVHALSDRRTGDTNELPVQVVTGPTQEPDPLLGWLLRDMANLSFVTAPRIDAQGDPTRAPLVVMAPSGDQSAWNANYIGSTRRLRSAWLPSDLPPLTGYATGAERWASGWRPRLRWLLYRAAPVLPEPTTVNLWATP